MVGLSFVISLPVVILFGKIWWLVTPIFSFLIIVITIALGWTQVPEKHHYAVELTGAYYATWQPGLYIRFPYFGLMRINSEVFMGQQIIKLYTDEVKDGGGLIDFKDGSSRITAFVYFTIVDAFKATYAINDVIRGVEEKMDAAIRSYLANFKIDEANELKTQLDAARILNGETRDEKGNWPAKKELRESNFWKEISNSWGVEIDNIIISDIALPEAVMKQRQRVLTAEKELEAAEIEKKTAATRAEGKRDARIIEADGEKQALALVGKGMADQIKTLKDAGLYSREAATNVVERMKWRDGVGGNAVIIESGGSGMAGFGAKFGAGKDAYDRAHGHGAPSATTK